jgi:hypothetical protein
MEKKAKTEKQLQELEELEELQRFGPLEAYLGNMYQTILTLDVDQITKEPARMKQVKRQDQALPSNSIARQQNVASQLSTDKENIARRSAVLKMSMT